MAARRRTDNLKPTVQSIIAEFGDEARKKLANPGSLGEPEDQLRAPFESLIGSFAELCGIPRSKVAAVGEASLSELKTRPDYAITVRNALVGFVELKAPGKGADPRRFKGHDKEQWEKLRSLPNLVYADCNETDLTTNAWFHQKTEQLFLTKHCRTDSKRSLPRSPIGLWIGQ